MKNKVTPQPIVVEPQVTAKQGLALIREEIKKGKIILSSDSVSEKKILDWRASVKDAIEMAFGKNSEPMNDISKWYPEGILKKQKICFPGDTGHRMFDGPPHYRIRDESEIEKDRVNTLRKQIDGLIRHKKNLERKIRLQKEALLSAASPQSQVRGNKIFLVHGHDREMKETTARLLEKLKLDVVIMDEKANRGKTLIEKLEGLASDVGYAVVLMTADDEGNAKGESPKPRARQNVIIELGYFIGKLGRDRVCVLYEEGVDSPSDFKGVAYHPIDSEKAWRYKLAEELREAGFQANMNLI